MAISAAVVWRVRPGGSSNNGAGYDATISGAGTDYSQQDTAQASGLNGTASGTTTFSDSTANAFTLAMVGNAIRIASGSGFTIGFYFVVAYVSASQVILDRSPGTGSAAVWKLGGAYGGATAHPFELARDSRATGDKAVPGNIIYIKGSSATPSSPDYSFSNNFLNPQVAGDTTNGALRFMVDPSQPTWRPYISNSGGDLIIANAGNGAIFDGLIFRPTSVGNGRLFDCSLLWEFRNCTWNMNDLDTTAANLSTGTMVINCEAYSKLGSAPVGRATALFSASYNNAPCIIGGNFHDLGLIAISSNRAVTVIDNVFNSSVAPYLQLQSGGGYYNQFFIRNNTFNGNTGDAIKVDAGEILSGLNFFDNVVSNNTGVGKYGVNIVGGSTAVNDRVKLFLDYNNFYNNTANFNGVSAGANDLTLDPQFTSSTDLTLNGTNLQGQAFPRTTITGG